APVALSQSQIATLADKEWRLDNLYYIVDEKGHEIQFKRNEVQHRLWESLWYWNLVLKARQHGISTFIEILMLDDCMFSANTHCGLIDATLPDARKKLDKIKFAYDRLPPEFRKANPLVAE